MNKLLSLFSKEALLKFLAFFLHAITPAMWEAAKDAVVDAEATFTSEEAGSVKFEWVKGQLSEAYAKLPSMALNWLIETALSYVFASLPRAK